NPIIKATISEGEKLSFTYDHLTDEITMDGSLALRSGEIYYFQKDFFITEGALTVHTESFGGLPSVQPTINLRAKLTDYDSSGNRVDIFLILREASFTALNPQFESIPAKATNEIFEILGQSILPSGAYGQFNLYSAAHLAAAATNVAERLGYINVFQTSALTETIRVSLGLDMFSLRSNILQNILLDTLPGATPGTTFSPLARYLNNTVIFMGKYIGTEFFLQALLHLSATEPNKIRNPFLAPDLSLNLELSIEWHNPLLTFSLFTQPNELSFIDILDTMGVSVTKRIVLR
ncbi:MAG TPA: translocation/assembly module TamB domain-containing protein, partial [Sphaerochaeta sp.]|nr:translocation/assembly module TamB domain-containing protein [Sphaerochaeta sp.]